MERKIILLMILLLFICCSKNSEYSLIDEKYPQECHKISISADGTKLQNQYLYKEKDGGTLYYLKINGEFYPCDSDYSTESVIPEVFMSTKKEYRIPDDKFDRDDMIIRKENDYYVTMIATSDAEEVVYEKYYYDKNYKIFKIESPWRTYEIVE